MRLTCRTGLTGLVLVIVAACGGQSVVSKDQPPAPIVAPAESVMAEIGEPAPFEVAVEPPAPRPIAAPVEPFPALRPHTNVYLDDSLSPLLRVTHARQTKEKVVQQLFADAGVSYPPGELLLRAYKDEQDLEVWAASERGGEMSHVTTYSICATSGELGPKRMEGDGQVPEGYYKIQYLWPGSDYYLSMKVSYPNVADRIRGHKKWPGSDIMIHGRCASIGCLAMSDERIEEIYTMSSAAQRRGRINVHIFPMRDRQRLKTLDNYAEHSAFWDNLYEGHTLFENNKRLPKVRVISGGTYSYTL
jgi:hypothetical protein